MVMYAKVVTLPDGGQQITVWEVTDEINEAFLREFLGEPKAISLLTLEQVVSSRDAVGAFPYL